VKKPTSKKRGQQRPPKQHGQLNVTLRSKARTLPFLELPAEIRNMVYEYAADWNDGPKHLHRIIHSIEEGNCEKSLQKVRMSTPTILLLNRQITAEVFDVLERKPLALSSVEPCNISMQSMNRVISATTLQKIPCIVLRTPLVVENLTQLDLYPAGCNLWSRQNSLQSLSLALDGGPTYHFEISPKLVSRRTFAVGAWIAC